MPSGIWSLTPGVPSPKVGCWGSRAQPRRRGVDPAARWGREAGGGSCGWAPTPLRARDRGHCIVAAQLSFPASHCRATARDPDWTDGSRQRRLARRGRPPGSGPAGWQMLAPRQRAPAAAITPAKGERTPRSGRSTAPERALRGHSTCATSTPGCALPRPPPDLGLCRPAVFCPGQGARAHPSGQQGEGDAPSGRARWPSARAGCCWVWRARAAAVECWHPPAAQVNKGEALRVVGNASFLGSWNPDQAPELEWHEGHVWAIELAVPCGEDIEFKASRSRRHQGCWHPGRMPAAGD